MLQLIGAWVTKPELVGAQPATSARRDVLQNFTPFAHHSRSIPYRSAQRGPTGALASQIWHFCAGFVRGRGRGKAGPLAAVGSGGASHYKATRGAVYPRTKRN